MNGRTQYLPADEVSLFCEQVALLLKSGIPLYDGVEALCRNYQATRFGGRFTLLDETMKRTGSLRSSRRSLFFMIRS